MRKIIILLIITTNICFAKLPENVIKHIEYEKQEKILQNSYEAAKEITLDISQILESGYLNDSKDQKELSYYSSGDNEDIYYAFSDDVYSLVATKHGIFYKLKTSVEYILDTHNVDCNEVYNHLDDVNYKNVDKERFKMVNNTKYCKIEYLIDGKEF